MSQLTRRIRLYGGDCNQTAMVVRLNGSSLPSSISDALLAGSN